MTSPSNATAALCERFLNDLDHSAASLLTSEEKLDVYQIGGIAPVLELRAKLTNQDFDVLNYQPAILEKLEQLFGKTTAYAKDHALYLELVPSALPTVPGGFRQRCMQVHGNWQHIRLWQPELHDLIVTKLKRFSPQDRSDIRFLCDQFPDRVQTEVLRERLDSALTWYPPDDDYQESTRLET